MEEEYIQQICEDIIRIKPDLVFTEKGVSGTSHTHTRAHRPVFLCQHSYSDERFCGCLRSGAALPDEGQHHSYPPYQEDRQQPYCQVNGLTATLVTDRLLHTEKQQHVLFSQLSGRVERASPVGLMSCARIT